MILGSHVSFKETQLLSSVNEAISYGANTFMFYTGAPQNTNRASISSELTISAHELMKKAGIDPKTLNRNATMNTRNVETKKPSMASKAGVKPMTQEEKDAAMQKSTEYYNKNAKPGSLAAKANMVKQYNERNNK